MGLGLEGLRQQLSEMIASSAQSTSQQAPDLANTRVSNHEIIRSFSNGDGDGSDSVTNKINLRFFKHRRDYSNSL